MEKQEKQQIPEVVTQINAETIVEKPSDTIDVKAIVRNYLRHWYWFLISLVVCGALGLFYMKKKAPVYLVQGMVMLNQNDDETTNFSGLSALASQFGFGGSKGGSAANIEDEMARLGSQKLLSQVVADTKYNQLAWRNAGFFKAKAFYGDLSDAPFRIDVPQEVLDTVSAVSKIVMKSSKDGSVKVTIEQKKKKVLEKEIERFPFVAKTPYATFSIDTTSHWRKGMEVEFHDLVMSTPLVIDDLRSCLGVEEVDKKGNGVAIYLETPVPQRGEQFVNTLVNTYNDNRYEQKLKKREEALAFVEGRLLNLYAELEQSENQIENFKRENKIVDAEAEAEYLFTMKGAIETAATQTRTELEIYQMARDMLTSPSNTFSLLPFASGSNDKEGNALASAVGAYNELILERMQLVSGVKTQSAALERLDKQISALRDNILKSLSREIEAKKIALAAVDGEKSASNSRMTEIPYMEKRLTQLYRDREVKNAIYAFLLQKREEASIAVQQVEPISEVIDPAYTATKPLSPKPMVVYSIALFFGLVLPLVGVKMFCGRKSKKKKKDADTAQVSD